MQQIRIHAVLRVGCAIVQLAANRLQTHQADQHAIPVPTHNDLSMRQMAHHPAAAIKRKRQIQIIKSVCQRKVQRGLSQRQAAL